MKKENKKVLIVDDDMDALDQMKWIIESMGYDTITGGNQKEGEKILEDIEPDLAIFDLMMENKDSGFILSYKAKKKYPELPVIIATAVTAETGMIFGMETAESRNWIKADHYMEKGIRRDQMEQTIKRLVNS